MQECPRCGAYLEDRETQCPFCNRDLSSGPGRSHDEIIAGSVRADALSIELFRHLAYMPLLTLPSPSGWDYRPLGLVTAQSVIGTGFVAELASSFADVFGRQSGTLRDKVRVGEETCKAGLRLDALRLGAHAVIGVNVNHAEVGGAKQMIMVCMAGTAVRLDSLDILDERVATSVARAGVLLAEAASARSG